MNSYALVFLAVLPFCVGSAVPSLPKVRLCKGEEPKLSACWKDNLKEIVHSLKDGVPQNNIPPLVPMYVPDFTLKTETFTSEVSHLNFDFSNFDIAEVICAPSTNSVKFKILIKELKMDAVTNVTGTVKHVDVSGVGTCKVSYMNVTITFNLEWENFDVNGVKYHNVFGDYGNIDFEHLEMHQYDVVKDPEHYKTIREYFLSVKETADYDKLLHKIDHSFLKHLLRYILRAYNSFQVASE